MSLFRSSLRPPAVLSDKAVERYVAALRVSADPDPAFRRRLRGAVLTQYVAAREPTVAGLAPRTMGRLGRAVLYASFALAVSVTGVMAASEAAVPGDALYPLKRAIEEMRVEVLPAQFHDDLAGYELNERLSELLVLANRGDEEVALLAKQVAAEYGSVIADAVADEGSLERRNDVLTSLVARLPDEARAAIDHAILAARGTPGGPEPGDRTASGDEEPAPVVEPGSVEGRGDSSGSAGGDRNGKDAGTGASNGGSGGNGPQDAQDGEPDDVADDEAGASSSAPPTPKPSHEAKSKAPAKP